MTELRESILRMPAGELGAESPLPPLAPPPKAVKAMRIDASVSRADRRHFGYGGAATILPYHMQDEYGRRRKTRAFRTAVLENEVLRAEFLLELGGRLGSLRHKPSGRELLYTNPVFQPANLAIRNAWFSGGVEWNVGLRGHCPFTCSPLFAAEVRRADGTPVLRLWEWERVRGVTFQVDTCLPEGSPFLLVFVRIVNPHARTVPMYWWSNAAVTETPGLRVLAPADSCLRTDYAGAVRSVPVPPPGGPDVTYPANCQDAADFFYRIPRGARPWIAALDATGNGMVHTSTRRLKGRKLFVWGMGAGGRRWQEFLSVPGQSYVEIQAGLARTQHEYLPMPARARWSWLEAYGLMQADPRAVHAEDPQAARDAVAARLEETLPERELESQLARMRGVADAAPARILQRGSGWGAMERIRRERSSEPPLSSAGLPFDDEGLTPQQQPWIELLERGALPKRSSKHSPAASLVQEEWRKLLESAVRGRKGNHWHAWLQLGTMRYAAGDLKGARQAWEKSLAIAPSPWAIRNLAVLAKHEGKLAESAEMYLRAVRMIWKDADCVTPNAKAMPGRAKRRTSEHDLPPIASPPHGLVEECCSSLIQAGRARDVLKIVSQLPPDLAHRGRVRLLQAQAAVEAGNWRLALKTLRSLEVADVREGDNITTELWFRAHEQQIAQREGVPIDDSLREWVRRDCPPPRHLDYRMFRQKK